MQNELIVVDSLLDETGNVLNKGWARKALLNYHRDRIKANALQIKEWDYYAALNDQFGIALTLADNGYLGIAVVTVFDFTLPKAWTKQKMIPFPLGQFNMPSSSLEGDISFSKKGFNLAFTQKGNQRKLSVKIKDFLDCEDLWAELMLTEMNKDSLMIATPFSKDNRFYYNHKINNMSVKGKMKLGNKQFNFNKTPSYAVLDWGRGVWTYNNTWYWGSASDTLNGHSVGFNIGYGFGDTSAASENIFYYDGIGHKLDQVVFDLPKDSYTDPWAFTSNDGRFEMTFQPVIDRCSKTKVLILESDQHQVFGYFSGTVTLDDGTLITVDRLFGFAEKVMNKW